MSRPTPFFPRLRAGESQRYRAREIKYDVMELTSRVPTDQVLAMRQEHAAQGSGLRSIMATRAAP